MSTRHTETLPQHSHDDHAAAAAHQGHGGHQGHDKHAGHDPEHVPPQVLAEPGADAADRRHQRHGHGLVRLLAGLPGHVLVGPVLGSVVFLYGGWPFLVGGVREVRDRAPGMMLLISMAITVAYVASLATSVGAFDLDFWWELAALVTIMLLGHWQEMKAIGQAQGALAALAALLPDDAERVGDDGDVERVAAGRAAGRRRGAGAPRRPGAGRRSDRRRRGRAGRVDDHRRVPAGAARRR